MPVLNTHDMLLGLQGLRGVSRLRCIHTYTDEGRGLQADWNTLMPTYRLDRYGIMLVLAINISPLPTPPFFKMTVSAPSSSLILAHFPNRRGTCKFPGFLLSSPVPSLHGLVDTKDHAFEGKNAGAGAMAQRKHWLPVQRT